LGGILLKNAVIIYFSNTGNTEKVAKVVKNGLEEENFDVDLTTVNKAKGVDLFDYDLVCVGSPSYNWMPPDDLSDFLKKKFKEYEDDGFVKLKAPKVEGRNAFIFCTYSGPHTGKNEAIPVVKYIGQFFEHLGFNIVDEMYVLSEMVGSKKYNTQGKMGDIRGLPGQKDLEIVKTRVKKLSGRI